jgi:hypothetical protein
VFNWLIDPSKSLAEGLEIAFAIGLFATTLLVVIGLIGEYRDGRWWRNRLHVFEMLVVIGVAGEMITETGAFWYSLKLQAIEERAIVDAQQTANNSAIEAANLGVSVDNLHTFVAQKESEADTQFTNLKTFVANEDVKNAEVIGEINRDRDNLDKARTDASASVVAADKILTDMRTALNEEKQVRDQMIARLAPRDLSQSQIADISTELRTFKGQLWTTTTYWDAREPFALTNKIAAVLFAAEWKYSDEGTKAMLLGGIEGVLVYTNLKCSADTKAAATALVNALNKAGIAAVFKQENNPVPNEKITVNVGSKP